MSELNGTIRIVDIGRAIPIVKGAWDENTAYEMLDIVSYNYYTYIGIRHQLGRDPRTAGKPDRFTGGIR